MAGVYRHFVVLQFLLVMLLMISSEQVADGIKGHFRRQEYSDREKHQWPQPERDIQHILNRTNRGHNQQPKTRVQYGRIHKLVKAQTLSTAVLPCGEMPEKKDNMINVTIKWFKRNNISRDILTWEEDTVVDDKRFVPSNTTDSKNLALQIKYAQKSDEGLYQCQMCWNDTADTCLNNDINLTLVEAHAKIFDGPTKEIRKDKELPLRLSCVLINSIEAPEYIFWYHGDRMINYDLEDGATVREGRQGSELIFPKANQTHAGNYSCVPSNAKLDSILVYYDERTTFAKSQDGSGGKKSQSRDDIVNMLVLISTFQLCR